MFEDSDDRNPGPITVPGAEPLGSQLLYPYDFVRQSEDVFPDCQGASSDRSCQNRDCAPPRLPSFGRILGMTLLFVACLAFPFLIPFVYVARRSGRR